MANGQGFTVTVGSGSVAPSTFVSFLTGTTVSGDVIAGYRVSQTVGSGTPICGVVQEGTRYAPDDENNSAGLSGYAGQYPGVNGFGDPIKVYGIGDICLLTLGTAVTPQQYLTANASGQGIPATGSANYGAIAQEGGVAGDLIRVQVQLGVY